MSHYYELKRDSEAYSEIKAMDQMWDKWHDKEITADINKVVGFDIDAQDTGMCGSVLMVKNIPSTMESQFKVGVSRYGFRTAKKKSRVNQAFVAVCKKHGLVTPDKMRPLMFKRGLGWHGGKKTLYTFDDMYYLETEVELPPDTEGYLRKISEIEFLEIQLAHKQKKAANGS